ncbi:MAG: fumarylacetoacetate hydrolase family protein [Bacteroidales bacterium]
MRFIMSGEDVSHGIIDQEKILEVKAPDSDWNAEKIRETGSNFALDEINIISPCLPSKIVCLGLNYRSHAEELNLKMPEVPIIFMKPSTSVIGPGEKIIYPPQSRRVDYEAELGVVIGRRAHRVQKSEALNYVFGYTCANDVTARDKQTPDGQWAYAKSFDTFCPLGPVIETEIKNPEALPIKGLLNGKVVQEATTADHLFTVAEIIEYVSGCMTLLPGDVIMTGTPSGIGPFVAGDNFEVNIEGIGSLNNELVYE